MVRRIRIRRKRIKGALQGVVAGGLFGFTFGGPIVGVGAATLGAGLGAFASTQKGGLGQGKKLVVGTGRIKTKKRNI
ncbi:hypothetical protein LCGC14_1385350 [marine sediment metagenome]|uniref:Glycine zipper domain-containing protein n=1 Tax=marine sediment metagenome TaxID=412755 RepID=A0A0F9K1R0_9ZZZZ